MTDDFQNLKFRGYIVVFLSNYKRYNQTNDIFLISSSRGLQKYIHFLPNSNPSLSNSINPKFHTPNSIPRIPLTHNYSYNVSHNYSTLSFFLITFVLLPTFAYLLPKLYDSLPATAQRPSATLTKQHRQHCLAMSSNEPYVPFFSPSTEMAHICLCLCFQDIGKVNIRIATDRLSTWQKKISRSKRSYAGSNVSKTVSRNRRQ